MQGLRTQIDQLRAQSRVSALNALSASNRTLLGQVVGQLAIAQTPDISAAAKTLDGRLSPTEAKTIVGISTALEQQIRQTMEAARAQMGGGGQSGGGPPGGFSHRPGMDNGPPGNDQTNTDAGMILLRLAVPPMGPSMRMGGPPGS